MPTNFRVTLIFHSHFRIKTQRDDKSELPADFGHQMNRWALESIGCIALDTRLGVLDKSNSSAESETIIAVSRRESCFRKDPNIYLFPLQNVHKVFDLMFQLDVQPSIWKFYKTSAFDELMKVFDTLTELIMKYVDQGIGRIETTGAKQDHEMGVLEKLLKVNRHVAAVMAFDMILAGVDTVGMPFKVPFNYTYCAFASTDILSNHFVNLRIGKES